MNEKQIFDRLVKLAKMKGSYSAPILAADMTVQEFLGEFQEAFAQLLLDVGSNVSGGQEKLAKEFPYAFKIK